MFTALQQMDHRLIEAATNLTFTYGWLTQLVYILAEVLIIVYPLTLFYLWYQPTLRGKKHGPQKAVLLAVMTLVVTLAVKEGLNFIYFRPRPFITYPDLLILNFRVDPQSFPSGHAMLAFAVSTSLYLSGYYRLGVWLLLAAVLVSLGRVFSGVHYPSDVLAGALIGLITAWGLHREASSIKRYLPND